MIGALSWVLHYYHIYQNYEIKVFYHTAELGSDSRISQTTINKEWEG